MGKFAEVYLDDVVEEQGTLYGDAADAGYDMKYFSDNYMSSNIRKQMKMGRSRYLNRFAYELMEEFEKEVNLKKASERQHGFMNG